MNVFNDANSRVRAGYYWESCKRGKEEI